jgi:hypothetical protein
MPTASTPGARAAASRANGSRSQGPVTAEGKAKAARNALKHGLTAAVPRLLASEDLAAFEAAHRQLLLRLRPQGEVEADLARKATWSAWLVRRADRLLAEFLDRVEIVPEGQRKAGAALAEEPRLAATFSSLERHRARLQREHERLVMALLDLIEARGAPAQNDFGPQNDPGPQNEPEAAGDEPGPAASLERLPDPPALPNRRQRRWLARQERKRSA